VTPYREIQKRVKWGDQEEVSRGREPSLYNRRVARESSRVGQKSEAE